MNFFKNFKRKIEAKIQWYSHDLGFEASLDTMNSIMFQRKQTNSNTVRESWIVFKESSRKKALTSPKKNISVQLHCHCITVCMSAIHVNDTEAFLRSHLCSAACHKIPSNQRKAFPPFSFAAVLPALTKPALLHAGCIPKDALGHKHSSWKPRRGGSHSQLTELLLSCTSTHTAAKHCQAQATWNIFPNFFSMWKHTCKNQQRLSCIFVLRLTRQQLCSECTSQIPTAVIAATTTAHSNPGILLITRCPSHKSLYTGPEHLFNSLWDDISLIPPTHCPSTPVRTLTNHFLFLPNTLHLWAVFSSIEMYLHFYFHR